jgi:hypothetical protein
LHLGVQSNPIYSNGIGFTFELWFFTAYGRDRLKCRNPFPASAILSTPTTNGSVKDQFETFQQVYEERFQCPYGVFHPYVQQAIWRYLVSDGCFPGSAMSPVF